MSGAARVIVWLCAFTLVAAPLAADVIPAKVDSAKDAGTRAAVAQSLEQAGLDAASAQSRAGLMTADVASHYASRPEAVRLVAGLFAEEALFGVAMLAALGIVAAYKMQDTHHN